jgi:flagellar L-ring protein FlgH
VISEERLLIHSFGLSATRRSRRTALAWLALIGAGALLQAACGSHVPRPDENYAATLPEEVPATSRPDGAIFQTGTAQTLFDDPIARRVGDVLTIELDENTNGSKSAVTTTKKTTTEAMAAPTLLGGALTFHGRNLLNNSLNDASTFDGEGDSSQSNQLTGSIAVTVAKVLANGNLLVRGQRWITINQGREYIRLQGIVRPIDIGQDNTISSTMVADATIDYGGKGALNDANTKGWLARFFDSAWAPF